MKHLGSRFGKQRRSTLATSLEEIAPLFAEAGQPVSLLPASGAFRNRHLNQARLEAWLQVGSVEMRTVLQAHGRHQFRPAHLSSQACEEP